MLLLHPLVLVFLLSSQHNQSDTFNWPSVQWSGGGDECSTSEYCGDTYGGGAFITTSAEAKQIFSICCKPPAVAFASEAKPSNRSLQT